MTRKTFEVHEFKEWVNAMLEREDNEHVNPDFRTGLFTALEHILFETNNYHGYTYLEWINGSCDQWIKDNAIYNELSQSGKMYPEHYTISRDTSSYIPDKSKRFYY